MSERGTATSPGSPHTVVLVLVIAALPRLWAAWADQGVFWPDEIYQSLEPAHAFAFGYGVLAWEFEEGARSWLFAGVLGLLFKAMSVLGFTSAPQLIIAAKLLMAGVSVLGVYGTLRLAQALGGATAGGVAGMFAATFPLLLLFGSRCVAETASGTVLVFAALALVREGKNGAVLAGVLAGAAVFLRYPNGLVLLGFLLLLAAQRRRDDLRRFLLAALAVGWLGGVLDWATWGAPFHSLLTYVRYNLEHQAELYGTASASYYAVVGWSSTGPALGVLGLGLIFGLRRAPALTLIVLAYVLIHSAIGHKEMRFLLPVVPMLLALAASGLVGMLEGRLSEATIALLAVALSAATAQRASTLTFADVGQYRGEPAGPLSPWHAGEGVNRLLWLAGRQPDLCGIWVTGIRGAWSGGYAYLHRPVPIRYATQPGSAAAANYALAPLAPVPLPLAGPEEAAVVLPPEFVPVAESRGWRLSRREGTCVRL